MNKFYNRQFFSDPSKSEPNIGSRSGKYLDHLEPLDPSGSGSTTLVPGKILFYEQVCGARVKTRDTLKQHRKKLHHLTTPIPNSSLIGLLSSYVKMVGYSYCF